MSEQPSVPSDVLNDLTAPRSRLIADADCVSFRTDDADGGGIRNVVGIRVIVRRERDRWALWFSLGITVGYALFDLAHRVM